MYRFDKKYLSENFQRLEPYQVFIKTDKGIKETQSWACGKCGQIYTQKEQAEKCCKDLICSQCGKIVEQYHLRNKDNTCAYYSNNGKGNFICRECWDFNNEQKHIDNALEDWKGAVYYDGSHYDDMDEFIEDFTQTFPDEELPEIVECVEDKNLPKVDIDRLMEWVCEEIGFEDSGDAFGMFTDVKELYTFMDEWNAKQTATYWQTNGKYAKVKRQK